MLWRSDGRNTSDFDGCDGRSGEVVVALEVLVSVWSSRLCVMSVAVF